MKSLLLSVLLVVVTVGVSIAQIERINKVFEAAEAESHLRFLTADELKGRDTGSEELVIAGRYIAEQFRRYGVTPLGDNEDDFLQTVPLENKISASEASLSMLNKDFSNKNNLVVLAGGNGDMEADLMYISSLDDYKNHDVTGKILITVIENVRTSASTSLKDMQQAGAVGLIQVYRPNQRFPWPLLRNYFSRNRMTVGSGEKQSSFPHIWVKDSADFLLKMMNEKLKTKAVVSISGVKTEAVKAFNVVGVIEGSDPELRKEHIVMSAHYDHVGIQVTDNPDSIYNGTRDNGIGTTGLLNAAKYFGQHPPRRSIILIALTGEEKGLLGSQYYADYPKIPLEETVMNLNIDNSGYTDTHIITLLDTNRTDIDDLVYQAAKEVGLGVIGDRMPDQNYYERSDQVSFASKGVPAVNFKMAMSAYDERVTKYYHQPEDEFHTIDLEYIHKYWKSYIRAAELIANRDKRPYWIPGDKFEPVGDALYGID